MADFDLDEIEEINVTLELEGEGEVECEVICIFEYGDSNFAALTPTDESREELYFFGIEMEENGDEVELSLENVEDDELLEELAAAFDELMNEEDEIEAAIGMDEEEEEDEDEDDSRWDEFITKKLD